MFPLNNPDAAGLACMALTAAMQLLIVMKLASDILAKPARFV